MAVADGDNAAAAIDFMAVADDAKPAANQPNDNDCDDMPAPDQPCVTKPRASEYYRQPNLFNDAALDAVLLSYFANTSNAKTSNADNSVPDADVDAALETYNLHQL